MMSKIYTWSLGWMKTEWPRPNGPPASKAWIGGWRRLGVWNGVREMHAGSRQEVTWSKAVSLCWCWHTHLILASWPIYIGPYFGQISHHSSCALKWLRTERIGPQNTEYIDWSFLWLPFISRSLPTFQQYFFFSFRAAFLFSLEVLRILF